MGDILQSAFTAVRFIGLRRAWGSSMRWYWADRSMLRQAVDWPLTKKPATVLLARVVRKLFGPGLMSVTRLSWRIGLRVKRGTAVDRSRKLNGATDAGDNKQHRDVDGLGDETPDLKTENIM